MLREWVAQDALIYWVDEVIKEDNDIVCWESEGKEEPLINDLLSHQQMKELQTLLHSFDDAQCRKPGKTVLTEHRIETGDA